MNSLYNPKDYKNFINLGLNDRDLYISILKNNEYKWELLTKENILDNLIIAFNIKTLHVDNFLNLYKNINYPNTKIVYKQGYLYDYIEWYIDDLYSESIKKNKEFKGINIKKIDLNDNGAFYIDRDDDKFYDIIKKELNNDIHFIYVINDLDILNLLTTNTIILNGTTSKKFSKEYINYIKSIFKDYNVKSENYQDVANFLTLTVKKTKSNKSNKSNKPKKSTNKKSKSKSNKRKTKSKKGKGSNKHKSKLKSKKYTRKSKKNIRKVK